MGLCSIYYVTLALLLLNNPETEAVQASSYTMAYKMGCQLELLCVLPLLYGDLLNLFLWHANSVVQAQRDCQT